MTLDALNTATIDQDSDQIMVECGMRVVRGKDWKWNNQDNGEGNVGTIVEIGKNGSTSSPDKTAVVHWDCSTRTNYRIGYQGFYDLRLLDNATIGVRHKSIFCSECLKSDDETKHGPIEGMRFKCLKCADINLCLECYMSDKHDLNHSFMRYVDAQSLGIKVGKRHGCQKLTAKGIYPGARVIRGMDWDWGNQDDKKEGTVLDIRGWENESSRSVANVRWDNDVTNVYRMGHKAKVDLTCTKEANWIEYYPDHLPSIGDIKDDLKPTTSRFKVGMKVRVDLTVDVLKFLQEGHGGWNPRMAEYLGKVGSVHRITEKGDIRVQYPDIQNRWTFHPDALTILSLETEFKSNDIVEICSDLKRVKTFQKGHGEWTDQMKEALGKRGKVLKVYPDGDLRVKVHEQNWTFNPINVKLIKPKDGGDHEKCSDNALKEKLLKAIRSSNIIVIREIIKQNQSLVTITFELSKTTLHESCAIGNCEIVSFFITEGAEIDAIDGDGNTPLHISVRGGRKEICRVLLEKNARSNIKNYDKNTPLHLAVENNSPDIVRMLVVEHSELINIRDAKGNTPLHEALSKDYKKIANFLLAQPSADLSLPNHKNFNALHISSLKGNITATKTICETKISLLNKEKDDGFTPLHLAALNGHYQIAEYLIQKGADIKLVNKKNQNALMLACSQGHVKVAHFLITNGASVDQKDDRGDTCLHMALNSQSQQKMYTLRSNVTGESWDKLKDDLDLSDYSGPENLLLACYLVKNGCNIEAKNSVGNSPMSKLNETSRKIVIKYARLCRICEETAPDVTLEPCNHKITCFDCSKKLKTCLECHVKITLKVHDNMEPEKNEIDFYQEKIRTLEESLNCIICMERSKNITFMCGHQACSICSAPLKLCHICRKPITKKINTF